MTPVGGHAVREAQGDTVIPTIHCIICLIKQTGGTFMQYVA